MQIGDTLKLNETVYEVTKKIDEYTYEIRNTETGELSLYAVGRPVPEEHEEDNS